MGDAQEMPCIKGCISIHFYLLCEYTLVTFIRAQRLRFLEIRASAIYWMILSKVLHLSLNFLVYKIHIRTNALLMV